jgi:hypothetical protein
MNKSKKYIVMPVTCHRIHVKRVHHRKPDIEFFDQRSNEFMKACLECKPVTCCNHFIHLYWLEVDALMRRLDIHYPLQKRWHTIDGRIFVATIDSEVETVKELLNGLLRDGTELYKTLYMLDKLDVGTKPERYLWNMTLARHHLHSDNDYLLVNTLCHVHICLFGLAHCIYS